jgi:RNA polymerase sigma-70 factor (ECF subfamily)
MAQVGHTGSRYPTSVMEQPLPAHKSEDYLVQRAIKRDREAFTGLYESCVERVYRHVYYRVYNHVDAEDITQEAFVKAWKAIEKYKSTGVPFVAWIITIAANLVADHYRKKQKIVNLEELFNENPDRQTLDPEKQVETSFGEAVIREAVLKLSGDKQKVILMHFIDGFSYEEIARALNKSEGAIRVIQYRALSDMRSWLKRD